MEKGKIHIYTGDGHGKTPAALGEALYAAAEGKAEDFRKMNLQEGWNRK